MKICKSCNQEKSLTEFRPNKSKKDGLQGYCELCDKEYQKKWYSKNKEKVKIKSSISNKSIRLINRTFIFDYLMKNPCVVCGETDPVVLEFDHLKNKKIEVAKLINNSSIKKITEEINKCQVLCSNCHKRKTAKHQNWFKYLKQNL